MDSTNAPNTPNQSSRPNSQESLLKAEAVLGLKWLKSRSELIRLELLTHQLELALLQAEHGNPQPLHQWFLNHGTPWQGSYQAIPHPTPAPNPPKELPTSLTIITTPTSPAEPTHPAATDIALTTSQTATNLQFHSPQTERASISIENHKKRLEHGDPEKKLAETDQPNSTLIVSQIAKEVSANGLAKTSRNRESAEKKTSSAQLGNKQEISAKANDKKEKPESQISKTVAYGSSHQNRTTEYSVRNSPSSTQRSAPKNPTTKELRPRPIQFKLNRSGSSTATAINDSQITAIQHRPKGKASALLTSLLLHSALVIALMLFTLPIPESKQKIGLTGSISSAEPFPLEIENNIPQEDTSLANEPPTDFLSSTNSTEIVPEIIPTSTDISNAITSTSLKPVISNRGGPEDSLLKTHTASPSQDAAKDASKLSKANFFGLETTGNLLCFVVDASGSMRGEPFQATKLELLRSISQLKANQRFCVLFFNQKLIPMQLDGPLADPLKPEAAYATPENLIRLQNWMETVAIGIGGPPNQALQTAIGLEPDAVFLLTDGITKSDVTNHLKKTNIREDWLDGPQIRCPIHTIGFYSRDGEVLLQQIANENGGQYRYVPNPQPDSKSKKMER